MESGTLATAGKAVIDIAKDKGIQDKTAGLLGMLFPYTGKTKKAVDLYIDEIKNSDMSTETKIYSIMNIKKDFKKIKNQQQIVNVALANVKEGTNFTESSGVNEEWLDRFMDSSGYVSSEEVQLIWGKILANEFEKPGSTPPNMIRILSEFTPTLAEAFRKLCSMSVWIGILSQDENIEDSGTTLFVPYQCNEDKFRNINLSFNVLNELETLGVIKIETTIGYISRGYKCKKLLLCIGDRIELVNSHEDDSIPIGNVILTSAGETLKKLTTCDEIPNYYEMIIKYLKSNNVGIAPSHDFQLSIKNGERYINKTLQASLL